MIQHVSISIQIKFRELVVSLLKSLSFKITKNIKGPLWQCGSIVWCVCVAFCVEMWGGLQYVWHSVWRCNLDCNMYGVLCGDVRWTEVQLTSPHRTPYILQSKLHLHTERHTYCSPTCISTQNAIHTALQLASPHRTPYILQSNSHLHTDSHTYCSPPYISTQNAIHTAVQLTYPHRTPYILQSNLHLHTERHTYCSPTCISTQNAIHTAIQLASPHRTPYVLQSNLHLSTEHYTYTPHYAAILP